MLENHPPFHQTPSSLPPDLQAFYESHTMNQMAWITGIINALMAGVEYDSLETLKRLEITLKFLTFQHRALVQFTTFALKTDKKRSEMEEGDTFMQLKNLMRGDLSQTDQNLDAPDFLPFFDQEDDE